MNDWYEAEHHVERAHEHYEAGRLEDAESELRRALEMDPYQAEWHFNLGLTLEAAGRYEDAAQSFGSAHELEPADGLAAINAAINLIEANREADALPWLDMAAEADEQSVRPYVHRIEAYTGLGQHDQAEVAFYLGQQLDAESGELYAAMADSLMERRRFEKAIWCLREAARFDSGLPRIQARLADVYAATGRRERARQLYLRELREDPGDIDTLLDLGDLLVEMYRDTEAAEKYHRVLELEPDNADAHFRLAELAEGRRLFEEAIVEYDVVLRLDPDYPAARSRLAERLIERGRPGDLDRGRALLGAELRAHRDRPTDFTAEDMDELGQLLLDAGLPQDATFVLQRFVKQRPADAVGRHHLSVAFFQSGDARAGEAHAREAIRLDPRFVPAMYNLSVAALESGRWMRARFWARAATRLAPDDPNLRRLRLRLRLQVVAEAAKWARRGVRHIVRRRDPWMPRTPRTR
ncbi:MAG: tetratricopeptide repeat protein [Planctomycetota bacterium]